MVNKQLDPENDNSLVETNLPTPMTARVYVNLLEGNLSMSWCGFSEFLFFCLFLFEVTYQVHPNGKPASSDVIC